MADGKVPSIRGDEHDPGLPLRRVLVIFAVLQLMLFLSCMDQTSVSTALPSISADLGAGDRMGWVGTSFLIATCSSQIVLARFSDIFGRKVILASITVIFMFGNILCGFAQNPVWLFTARGIAGIGAGGMISLVMIVVSDIVSMKERGRFQGLIALGVGLGNGLGPIIGGSLSTISWRWAFWISPPFLFVSLIPIWIFVPNKSIPGNFMEKVRQIDFTGSFFSLVGFILLLIPLSGGGTVYAWNSATVISLLVAGVVTIVIFIYTQWRAAEAALLPLRIFRNRTVSLIFCSTVCMGWVYFGLLFYLPLYFQEIHSKSSTLSGVLILPMVLVQPIFSALCGQITTWTGHNVPLIQIGFVIFTIATGLFYRFDSGTSIGYAALTLVLSGIGIGMTLQTTLVAAQFGAPYEDRAIVTGARNTARTLGGAIGLAASGNIRNALSKSQLITVPGLPLDTVDKILRRGVRAVEGKVDDDTLRSVRAGVMHGIHGVFISFIPVIALALLFSLGVPNHRVSDEAAITPPADKQELSSSDTVDAIPPVNDQPHRYETD